MIVPIPKLRRIPTQGIACWSRHPRCAPDCNKQAPLRNCTISASTSKQLAPHSVKSQPAIITAKPINAVAGSINALEQVDCSDVWRQNKSRQDLQRLRKTHVDSEWKHAHNTTQRSIESVLSIFTAEWCIRAKRTHLKQPHRRFCNVEVAALITRCGGTLQRSGASGERHVCNSALNEYNSILEPCHINLRTTRENFSAPPNDFPQCTRDTLHCQKPTCDLYRQANQCGCGIHQRAQNMSRQALQRPE